MAFGWEDLARLLAACVAGAAIGLERELSDKPAGLRTNVMICLGAAVFTMLSTRMGLGATVSDPARIAAQVVTGVGFLGAGAILHAHGNVIGLTTAATIWIVASVGMTFGSGSFILGTVATVLTVGVLFGLSFVENWIAAWRTTAKFMIEMKPEPEVRQMVKRRVRELGLQRRAWRVSKTPDGFTGFLEVTGPESRLGKLYKTIMAEEGIESLERL